VAHRESIGRVAHEPSTPGHGPVIDSVIAEMDNPVGGSTWNE
jgi:hypothetical protein